MADDLEFDSVEDELSYYKSLAQKDNKEKAEPKDKAPAFDEAKFMEQVTAKVDEKLKTQKDEKQVRVLNTYIKGEGVTEAVKKTFGDKEDEYKKWEQELNDGKVDLEEVKILQGRGEALLKKEQEEKNIKEGKTGDGNEVGDKYKNMTGAEADLEISKVLQDPERSFLKGNNYKPEERKADMDEIVRLIDVIQKDPAFPEEDKAKYNATIYAYVTKSDLPTSRKLGVMDAEDASKSEASQIIFQQNLGLSSLLK